jgi:hypothetical protein
MLKLNASYARKIPGDEPYSSLSYAASIEVEVASNLSGEELKAEIHRRYEELETAVAEQINGKSSAVTLHKGAQEPPEGPASLKQIRYILDLAKGKERRLSDLNEEVKALFHVSSIYELNKSDASRFLDRLTAA